MPGVALMKRNSCVASADNAMMGVDAGNCRARPITPVVEIGPAVVTLPLARLTMTTSSCVRPEARTTATPEPVAGVALVVTVTVGGISKPWIVSTGTDSGWHIVCVPAFGGF